METKLFEISFDELTVLCDALADFIDEDSNRGYIKESEKECISLSEKIHPLWEKWWEEKKKEEKMKV